MPTPTAYEKWAAKAYNPQINGWTAQRAWKIVGARSEDQALSAVAAKGVSFNSQHPLNSLLKCDGLNVGTPEGPVAYEVTANYSMATGGGDHVDPTVDPLSMQPDIEWGCSIVSTTTDRDADNQAITNSARFLFDQPQTLDIYEWSITIYRNEPFYDWLKARAFQNRVNQNEITFLGYDMPAGCLKCVRIMPTARYKWSPAPAFLPIAYTMNFRESLIDDTTNPSTPTYDTSPFHHWLLDAGYQGWFDDGGVKKSGPFCHGASVPLAPVTDPVRLTGNGLPWDSSFLVTKDGKTPKNMNIPPGATAVSRKPGTIGSDDNLGRIFLVYPRHRAADFTLMGI